MKKLLPPTFIILACAAFVILAGMGNAGAQKQDTSKAACLSCHGPYEKLVAKPPSFKGVDPGKSKITTVNPHQFWPHEDKTEKGIQDCTTCHKPHKVPFAPSDTVEKATVEPCFGCHHDKTFDRCKSCHEN